MIRSLSEQEHNFLNKLAKEIDADHYYWYNMPTQTINYDDMHWRCDCRLCGCSFHNRDISLHGLWHIKQSKLGAFI